MPKAILGKKLGMTQVFSPEGKIVPVTVIVAGPCHIAQIKTEENDGYQAVQLGFDPKKAVNVIKAEAGHAKKADIPVCRFLREVRVDDLSGYELGGEVNADIFEAGEIIDVSGISKGKGFAGTIKRYGHRRGPSAHGSKNHRRPASAGAKGPARVFKGKKSPGRMGGDSITVQNLEIVKIDSERQLMLVRGAVPGPKGGMVVIKSSVKA